MYTFYIFRAEEEGDDIVDSDFSIDENDEPVSDNEGEGEQKKKRRLVTKAYKVSYLSTRIPVIFTSSFLGASTNPKKGETKTKDYKKCVA